MANAWQNVCVATLFLVLQCLVLYHTMTHGDGSTPIQLVVGEASSMRSVVDRSSHEPCTFAAFREAYRRQDYFPAGGEWLKTGGVEHFQPTICKYRYPRVTDAFMKKCLSKANISYVVTMGDSTGGRYSSALVAMSKLKCQPLFHEALKEDGFLPDKSYFTRRMSDDISRFVAVKFRFCSGCKSNLVRCDFSHDNNSYSVELEHIAQTMILDDSLQIGFRSYAGANRVLREAWALTTQELVFRYYLDKKQPDVFLIFLPFSHAKHNMRMSRLPMEIEYFKKLIEEYLPNTTKLIYFPCYGEFREARADSRWRGVLFEGMLAREKINEMNRVLYELLKDDLQKSGGRYFGFLDLIDVSKDRGNWSTDGVHMKAVWYESIMSMFWETYCNSVLLNMF